MGPEFITEEYLYFFLSATDDSLARRLQLVEELNLVDGFPAPGPAASPLRDFHPVASRMVLRDDGYYLGCRANHFALIYGWTEAHIAMEGDSDFTRGDCVVCLANHKGTLQILLFAFTGGKGGNK